VDSVQLLSSTFVVDTSQFKIAPADSLVATVTFQPTTEDEFLDYLTIYSNSNDTTVALFGKSCNIVPSPEFNEAVTLCGPGSATVTVQGETSSYRWYTSETGSDHIEGAASNVFEAKNIVSDTTFYVAAINENLCESARISVSIQVSDIPELPIITTADGADSLSTELVLVSSYTNGNQWYQDGNVLPDSTSNSLMITETGNYQVQYTNDLGCSVMSESFTITGLETLNEDSNLINIFPNPTEGVLNIETTSGLSNEKWVLSLFDMSGGKVLETQIQFKNGRYEGLDISSVTNGVYVIVLKTRGSVVVKRIQKN
jgi:hypothetical protein